LIQEGNSWRRSAFLSSFFALVGTHGLHIFCGLIWMLIMVCALAVRGLSASNISKVFRLAYFWHFLDVVWIFIFSVVYAMGHLI
jgi:cytochrome o ubiquinol oxidase subunit 3